MVTVTPTDQTPPHQHGWSNFGQFEVLALYRTVDTVCDRRTYVLEQN